MAAVKGSGLFDPGVPLSFRAHDLGPGLHHVHYIPSPVNKCCLASFNTGALHLYRLHPEVEKMQEWAPPHGALMSINIGPRDDHRCHSVVVLVTSGQELLVFLLHLDPRKSWLRPTGSATVTRGTATLLRASCSFARKCLATLYDDGTVMLHTLPQVKDASIQSHTVAVLGSEVDAQLLKAPDDHCCSLNYYTPDYLFLLVFSRKENAAVYRIYDLHLHTLHTSQALPLSSGWAHMPVTSNFHDGAMTVEVGRRAATIKRLQLVVPVVPSNLLDVLSGETRVTNAVERNVEVLDLTTALKGLEEGPDTTAHATAYTRQHAQTSDTPFTLLDEVRALCKKKELAELRSLVAKHSICLIADEVPDLLPTLLEMPEGSTHLQWYFSTVQRIKSSSLLAGLHYVLANTHDTTIAMVTDAVLEATAKQDALAETVTALELSEVLGLLKFLHCRMVQLLQVQCHKGEIEDVGARLYNLLTLSIALIDAHITELIASSAEAYSIVEGLQVLCKSYSRYICDLVELQGYLTCIVGDPTTLCRPAVSKDISAGLLRPPQPVRGLFSYYQVHPKPFEAAAPRSQMRKDRALGHTVHDRSSQKRHKKRAVSSA
eukprot:GGOE01036692.1.p1 GENE.GGOE01036692.1~~GGOE01036692.1.p1  ORF type:complete len:611 (+),score=157.45 GGOE01036692.1:29-1834(+)